MKNVSGTEVIVTFDNARLSEANCRKSYDPQKIETLAATLLAVGQLQNVVVVLAEDGMYEIVAGGRRYRAWALLVEQGKIPSTFPIRALLVTAEQATSVSLIENDEREDMHAIDRSAAYARLVTEGWSIDRIADAMGVHPLDVERRLIINGMAPGLKEEFRLGSISVAQLMALSTTPDHATQESVWKAAAKQEFMRNPANLKKAALGAEVDASKDKRVAFIGGIEVFEQAGGYVRRDLLSEENAGFIADTTLLDQLVVKKLETFQARVQKEGWPWVYVLGSADLPVAEFHRLGEIEGTNSKDRKAILGKIEPLRGRLRVIERTLEQGKVDGPEAEALETEHATGIERLEALRTELLFTPPTFTPELRAYAGAVVAMENGQLVIHRGRVLQKDRKAVEKIKRAAVRGGRETKPAGRPNEAMSQSLTTELKNLRAVAIASELAKSVQVAKALFATRVVVDHRAGSSDPQWMSELPTNLRDSSYRELPLNEKDWSATAIKSQIAHLADKLFRKLPEEHDALWDAVMALPSAEVDAIIAFGVGMSFRSDDDKAHAVEKKILGAIEFDMSQHYAASVENFTGRVPKGLVIEALGEIGKATDKAALLALKGPELAKVAAERLAATRWVPKIIRGASKPVRSVDEKGKATSTKPVIKPAVTKVAAKKVAPKKVVAKKVVAKKAQAKAPAQGKKGRKAA